jgi:hypothetical protein
MQGGGWYGDSGAGRKERMEGMVWKRNLVEDGWRRQAMIREGLFFTKRSWERIMRD